MFTLACWAIVLLCVRVCLCVPVYRFTGRQGDIQYTASLLLEERTGSSLKTKRVICCPHICTCNTSCCPQPQPSISELIIQSQPLWSNSDLYTHKHTHIHTKICTCSPLLNWIGLGWLRSPQNKHMYAHTHTHMHTPCCLSVVGNRQLCLSPGPPLIVWIDNYSH